MIRLPVYEALLGTTPMMVFSLEQNCEFNRNRDRHVRSIERVIQAMVSRLDLTMSNEQMAAIACFSPCHFNRLFHKMTGIPPGQFHYALRVARAKELLIDTEMSITDICFDVGYNSLGTFVSRFKKLVGLSPTAFRQVARQIARVRLADFPLPTTRDLSPRYHNGIVGTIDCRSEAAIIFVGLFNQALPVGEPQACTLVLGEPEYELPIPPDGLWYVLSVAVPRTSFGIQLLILKNLPRGRSGPILVEGGRWIGDSTITLSEPSVLDPPILAALPVRAERLHNSNEFFLRPVAKRFAELPRIV